MTIPILEVIEAKPDLVKKHLQRYDVDSDGCWIWNGPVRNNRKKSKYVDQYGVASFKVGDKSHKIGAHRLSYAYYYKKEPGELSVLHRCDKPLCINPRCHFLGTHQDNMDDRTQKGRNTWAILTEVEALWVISRLKFNTDKEICLMINNKITTSSVRSIRNGKNWKHLPRDAA